MSREYLENKLNNTTIPIIRLIAKPIIKKGEDFKQFLGKSGYYDGNAEGIYLRICEGDFTIARGKIVRETFICGDEHWSKNTIIQNSIIKV